MGINKIILIGKVKEEPVITNENKSTPKMATLKIITNESVLEDTTQKYQGYEEVRVYGGLIDIIEKSVTKGTTVYLEGKLKTIVKEIPTWRDKKYTEETTEIIVSNRTRGKIQILQDVKKNEMVNSSIYDNSMNNIMINNEDPGFSEKEYSEYLNRNND